MKFDLVLVRLCIYFPLLMVVYRGDWVSLVALIAGLLAFFAERHLSFMSKFEKDYDKLRDTVQGLAFKNGFNFK